MTIIANDLPAHTQHRSHPRSHPPCAVDVQPQHGFVLAGTTLEKPPELGYYRALQRPTFHQLRQTRLRRPDILGRRLVLVDHVFFFGCSVGPNFFFTESYPAREILLIP